MEHFLEKYGHLGWNQWYDALEKLVKKKRAFLESAKGNFEKLKKVVEELPDIYPNVVDLSSDLLSRAVSIGQACQLLPDEKERLYNGLVQLSPWRKGPFDFFGIHVDSEWQSWMKWERLVPHLPSLKNRKILDIGSSNGYYMFKMAASDPMFSLGLEPQSYFYYQYCAAQKYLDLKNVFCLPVAYDELPAMDGFFDLVLCMGILYHRKSPVKMLRQIHDSLVPGGRVVVENLVIRGENNYCLFPFDRYAKMRNVFFIPDLSAMEAWLVRAGFSDIRCVDITDTTPEEQRKTQWIQTESLENFLDPEDPEKTVEGYPAPVRAIFLATA
ncbi:tRNA 5-methoxyuridine(34)/uridine 5-oxyacetic acid(34) synthase CmoB [Desulfobacter postgatei]|mgnify:CR=1 FL=1|uniref:tRNA 5-methoxyuridine(34)/uridine 5-oxyacetic acid(34) synthase CmoB n=1 Tax=Desulfobacter postgatei TaxID=2293 RepID=UPI00259BD2D2|nr:tRNA 5-methoxyuridine(34)/uridine 5-oxyacetic acid(34) synthase CmoB [uncultured Desulfobacter sp.]